MLAADVRADVFLSYPTPVHGDLGVQIQSLEADFGGGLPSAGLQGTIVLLTGNDMYACAPLSDRAPSNMTAIAVIKRGQPAGSAGQCFFDFKVRMAQDAGYFAVIVYNDDPSGLVEMGADGPPVTIPSVFITLQDATAYVLNAPNLTTALLTPDAVMQWPSFLISFIVIVAGTVFMFTLFMFYRQRVRGRLLDQGRLSSRQVRALFKSRSFAPTDASESCCICLEEYAVGNKLLVLPCDHKFHDKCIEEWLHRRKTCPMCKRDPTVNECSPLLAAETDATA